MSMDRISVTRLFLYPIKSCRGIAVQTTHLHPMGFDFDRRWMLVDDANVFITQRTHPRLATISVTMHDDRLEVLAPRCAILRVPIGSFANASIAVRIWKDTLDAHPVSEEADRWFSAYLGDSVRLMRIPEGPVRRIDPKFGRPDDHVSFADAFPLLITSEESLEALNGRLTAPLPMDRFRPNIVVSGGGPFGEDGWTMLRRTNLELRLVKRCARCVTTTVDQKTGSVGKEPLATLATFRRSKDKVFFGMNAIPDSSGEISVGDMFVPDLG